MRVLFVTTTLDASAGGILYTVFGPAKSLRELGVEVIVAGVAANPVEAYREAEWGTVPVILAKYYGPAKLAFSPTLYRKLLRVQFDVVHFHGVWSYPLKVALGLALNRSVPLMITPQGMLDPWILGRGRFQKYFAKAWYVNRAFRYAKVIQALHPNETDHVLAFSPHSRVVEIPNGVEMDACSGRHTGRLTSADAGDCRLLFLGRLHPKKGVCELISAHSIAASQNMDYKRYVVLQIAGFGDSDYVAKVQSLVNAAASKGIRIEFLGPKFGAEKSDLYRSASWFVLPSYGEGQPMAVLEAWAAGVPVAITEACNISDGFESGAAVTITTDSIALAVSLIQLYNTPNGNRIERGEKGRLIVSTRYSWVSVATSLTKTYRSLLDGTFSSLSHPNI